MSNLILTQEEQGMLAGDQGPAIAMCMRLIVGVAKANQATRLIEVESAHADGCLYHGIAGLEYTEKLVELGGKVKVRTTTNVSSLDLLHPELIHADRTLATNGKRLMDAHLALGCEATWTCAPYQTGHRPSFGSQIAWAESNAIVFANSVLGARTDRYGDFLDISAAIVGRVPFAGLHTDEGRKASLVLDFSEISRELLNEESAWPAIGALLGDIAESKVVAIIGLPGDLSDGGLTEDRLKGLGATAASSGGVGLFHIVGVTPEAPTLDAVVNTKVETIKITTQLLRASRDRLTTAAGDDLDAVSLGTPHFSLAEFENLANELSGGDKFSTAIDFYVSTSRGVLQKAEALGYAQILKSAGGRIVTDTCTYVTPVLNPKIKTVMTNSGKWAWYAPGNLGIETILGSVKECIASARAGKLVRNDALWR
jgi:predicted aconitase